MKYYSLGLSTDEKVIGKYHQIKALGRDCDLSLGGARSMKNLVSRAFPSEAPNLDYMIMDKKAKPTDVISTGYITAKGFFMNQRSKDIFDKFNLVSHKYYSGRVEYKQAYFDYYWLHLVNESYGLIDFDQSTFSIFPLGTGKPEEIKIDSEAHLGSIKKEAGHLKTISLRKLVLNEKFKLNRLDLFFFLGLHYDVFISEDFKMTLEKESVTGIKILEQGVF